MKEAANPKGFAAFASRKSDPGHFFEKDARGMGRDS